jgi:hypothetical protein
VCIRQTISDFKLLQQTDATTGVTSFLGMLITRGVGQPG